MKEIMRKMTLSSDRSGGAGAAIAIVIILVIVGIAGYFVVLNGSHATLDINVQSTHILADTDVTIYVDGQNIGTWRLDNLGNIKITHDYTWSMFNDTKVIEVKAISTGGYLGAQGDSEIITVHKDGVNKVTLLI
ncbi:MAG: hypothetical protein LBU30_03525 [Candidatus Methanoplasma sp.]|nr:hypothetical protein [Candidatus Methanoplasma sp.]